MVGASGTRVQLRAARGRRLGHVTVIILSHSMEVTRVPEKARTIQRVTIPHVQVCFVAKRNSKYMYIFY